MAYNTPVFITLRNISKDCFDDADASSDASSSSSCNDNLNLTAAGGSGVWNSAYMLRAELYISARVGLGRDDDVEVAMLLRSLNMKLD